MKDSHTCKVWNMTQEERDHHAQYEGAWYCLHLAQHITEERLRSHVLPYQAYNWAKACYRHMTGYAHELWGDWQRAQGKDPMRDPYWAKYVDIFRR